MTAGGFCPRCGGILGSDGSCEGMAGKLGSHVPGCGFGQTREQVLEEALREIRSWADRQGLRGFSSALNEFGPRWLASEPRALGEQPRPPRVNREPDGPHPVVLMNAQEPSPTPEGRLLASRALGGDGEAADDDACSCYRGCEDNDELHVHADDPCPGHSAVCPLPTTALATAVEEPWRCAECGAKNEATSGKCSDCGYVIGPVAVASATATDDDKCPACGAYGGTHVYRNCTGNAALAIAEGTPTEKLWQLKRCDAWDDGDPARRCELDTGHSRHYFKPPALCRTCGRAPCPGHAEVAPAASPLRPAREAVFAGLIDEWQKLVREIDGPKGGMRVPFFSDWGSAPQLPSVMRAIRRVLRDVAEADRTTRGGEG